MFPWLSYLFFIILRLLIWHITSIWFAWSCHIFLGHPQLLLPSTSASYFLLRHLSPFTCSNQLNFQFAISFIMLKVHRPENNGSFRVSSFGIRLYIVLPKVHTIDFISTHRFIKQTFFYDCFIIIKNLTPFFCFL